MRDEVREARKAFKARKAGWAGRTRPATEYEVGTTFEGFTSIVARRGTKGYKSTVLVTDDPDTLRLLPGLLSAIEQGATLRRGAVIDEVDGEIVIRYPEEKEAA